VSFLFALSLLLESWSVSRARRAVEALLDLSPPTARLKEATGSREVPVGEVAAGSLIIVKPGERIPLDGKVVRGTSDVNQAPITGESVPVTKHSGDEVFAGTINGDGTLEVKTTKAASDTTLAHIIRLVSEARSRRSASEQWVDRFARWYTPIVMIVALLVFILPPMLFAQPWSVWLYRALVLLVIACPCALVISTPVSIVAALAAAARNGVLVKGGAFMEMPARLKAIAFDKTGTLTSGRPVVQKIVPLSGHNERELLERAAALEVHSNHPIARAVIEYASRLGVAIEPAQDFKVLQGKGAIARINGRIFWLGSHRLLEERGQESPELHEQLVAMSDAGHTVVVIGNEDHVCGLISLADAVRPVTAGTIAELRRLGVQHLVMMTGDNKPTATAIAAQIGLTDIRAELLPQDKVTAIEELTATLGDVAMVGDGVNDAPALARASLGIAMGAAGSDAAIEAADIALMSDDLSKLPWLIRHSRRTLSIVRQNIVFALAVKGAVAALTIVGFASLWAAIAADVGASLLVVVNGLRLLRGGINLASLPHTHSIARDPRPRHT
jgi:Cd2+/Zn2+-exporting ATPase